MESYGRITHLIVSVREALNRVMPGQLLIIPSNPEKVHPVIGFTTKPGVVKELKLLLSKMRQKDGLFCQSGQNPFFNLIKRTHLNPRVHHINLFGAGFTIRFSKFRYLIYNLFLVPISFRRRIVLW